MQTSRGDVGLMCAKKEHGRRGDSTAAAERENIAQSSESVTSVHGTLEKKHVRVAENAWPKAEERVGSK
jgi:hypothetical protein